MSRIDLADTLKDMIVKCAEGNPGALTVLCRIVEEHAAIDPDSALPGLMPV